MGLPLCGNLSPVWPNSRVGPIDRKLPKTSITDKMDIISRPCPHRARRLSCQNIQSSIHFRKPDPCLSWLARERSLGVLCVLLKPSSIKPHSPTRPMQQSDGQKLIYCFYGPLCRCRVKPPGEAKDLDQSSIPSMSPTVDIDSHVIHPRDICSSWLQ